MRAVRVLVVGLGGFALFGAIHYWFGPPGVLIGIMVVCGLLLGLHVTDGGTRWPWGAR